MGTLIATRVETIAWGCLHAALVATAGGLA